MELFKGAAAVRLRSHHDKYLVAEADQEHVSQSRSASSPAARWTVELLPSSPSLIRLKSCHGRYLTASDVPFFLGVTGRKVLQSLPRVPDSSLDWEPVREGFQVKLKTRYGHFLRANAGLPPWRNSVTHDIPHRTATQDWVLWDIVHVADYISASPTLSPTPSLSKQESLSSTSSSLSGSPHRSDGRTIYYAIADEDGEVEDGEVGAWFTFKGTSVAELTEKMEEETGIRDVFVCARNPLNGKLYPLRLHLPPNSMMMKVVVVPASSRDMGKKIMENDDGKSKNLSWTDPMDEALVDELLNQQAKGNRINGTFTTTAYMEILEELEQVLNIDLTKEKLKHRIKTIKTHFNECYDLFKNGLGGFSWSETTKIFDAEPEVWNALIEAKPNAKKWRTQKFSIYDKLVELYAKDRATGSLAATAKERKQQWKDLNKTPMETIDGIDHLVSQNEVILENFGNFGTGFEDTTPLESARPLNDTPSSKTKRKRSSSCNEHDSEMIDAVRSVAAALKEGNDIYEKAHKKGKAKEEIYTKLEEIEMGEDKIDDAYLFLTMHDDRMRQFLGCPIPRRKKLLERMMSGASKN